MPATSRGDNLKRRSRSGCYAHMMTSQNASNHYKTAPATALASRVHAAGNPQVKTRGFVFFLPDPANHTKNVERCANAAYRGAAKGAELLDVDWIGNQHGMHTFSRVGICRVRTRELPQFTIRDGLICLGVDIPEFANSGVHCESQCTPDSADSSGGYSVKHLP